MNDVDFEAYLNLLARFLRLNPEQREDIRRELRAHLEDAIEAEVEAGVPREEAVARVLDDFGDAAELAARFSDVGRKRRWIMKGSLIAASVGFGVFLFNGFQMPGAADVGAGEHKDTTPALVAGMPALEEQPYAAEDHAIEEALARGGVDVTLEEIPLEAAMRYFADSMKINLVVYWNDLENYGIDRDRPVTLKLHDVTTGRALDLLLDLLGTEADLGAEINDGILVVASKGLLREKIVTRVYAVSDILDATVDRLSAAADGSAEALAGLGYVSTPRGGMYGGGGGGAAGMAGEMGGGGGHPSGGFSPGAGPRGGGSTSPEQKQYEFRVRAAVDLMELIKATISPDTWTDNGGTGSLRVFNDVLVVRQPRAEQRDVARLLDDLRRAGAATTH